MSKIQITRRQQLKNKIRSRVSWTAERPRMSVYKSNTTISVQVIDDTTWTTLASWYAANTIDWAKKLWKEIAEKCTTKEIVFDRNAYRYHWKLKTLADTARENGLIF